MTACIRYNNLTENCPENYVKSAFLLEAQRSAYFCKQSFKIKVNKSKKIQIQTWAGTLKYFDGFQKSHRCWGAVFFKMSPKAWTISSLYDLLSNMNQSLIVAYILNIIILDEWMLMLWNIHWITTVYFDEVILFTSCIANIDFDLYVLLAIMHKDTIFRTSQQFIMNEKSLLLYKYWIFSIQCCIDHCHMRRFSLRSSKLN